MNSELEKMLTAQVHQGGCAYAVALVQSIFSELASPPVQQDMSPEVLGKLKRFATVQECTREVVLRAITSLETHADVMGSDVAQMVTPGNESWNQYFFTGPGYMAREPRLGAQFSDSSFV